MSCRLKELLAQDKLVRVFGMGQLCHPKLIRLIGLIGGFDAVWLDQEHAGLTIGQIEEAALAARAHGLDSFVRLTATDYATVMRPLEAGANGIMAAQVRGAAQAAEIMSWAKFHPRGQRGINASGAEAKYGLMPLHEFLTQANADSFVAIQIEHIQAVAEVEQIAAIPDVDVLFVGPADLTQSMGIPAQWDHPEVWQALERVSAACRRHGTHWAILPTTPAYARRCVDLGCRMLSIGLDVWAWRKGIDAFKAEYAEFMEM
ncbi:MAG: HpcH/HpaI aldolase family protein [Gemmataceae bacterium]